MTRDARPSLLVDCRRIDIEFTPWIDDYETGSPFSRTPGDPKWTISPKGAPYLLCTCGHIMGVGHQIAPDGTVSPSLHHPATDDVLECGFHVFGRFIGWETREYLAGWSTATRPFEATPHS